MISEQQRVLHKYALEADRLSREERRRVNDPKWIIKQQEAELRAEQERAEARRDPRQRTLFDG